METPHIVAISTAAKYLKQRYGTGTKLANCCEEKRLLNLKKELHMDEHKLSIDELIPQSCII